MKKYEEIAKVRQRALADLAKVDAFEKKLLGGSAGSSKPKAAGASAAAAISKEEDARETGSYGPGFDIGSEKDYKQDDNGRSSDYDQEVGHQDYDLDGQNRTR